MMTPRDLAVNAIIAHRLFLKTLTLTNRYNDAVTNSEKENGIESVSYTHLTLPTILLV